MKRIQTSIACLIALAFVGVSTVKSVDNGQVDGKAIVRTIHGTVEYSADGSSWNKLHVNMELDPGAKIRTAPDSTCDLNVNNSASVVRVLEDTTMSIPTMNRTGSGYEADTTTMLDLQSGILTGNVKKLAANSRYEITTPHGVAGIRGTDFRIEVRMAPDGKVIVTFASLTGEVFVSAVVEGNTVVKVLHTGQYWTPGVGDVATIPVNLYDLWMNQIPPLNMLGALPQPVPIAHPFPTGTPPEGGTSSPTEPSLSPNGAPF